VRLSEAFSAASDSGRAALVLYLTGCYPDKESFPEILAAAAEYADIIEIGIPFSDPLADGPVIQKASEHVLASGISTDDIFDALGSLPVPLGKPVAAMGYWNTVFHYGMEAYAKRCSEVGISGVILPDLPPEEADEWLEIADSKGIDTVFLVAPTSSDERLQLVAGKARGFVYCVSITGVTGARTDLPPELGAFVERVRKFTDKPLAVGFGVSTPEHATTVGQMADGVVIGSALLRAIDPAATQEQRVSSVRRYLEPIRDALRGD